jgi:hypothetical protein
MPPRTRQLAPVVPLTARRASRDARAGADPSPAVGSGRIGGIAGAVAGTVTGTVSGAVDALRDALDRSFFDWTPNEVDDWGRDPAFVGRAWTASHLRWHVAVGGEEHLPRRGGALVVVNARRFALAPVYAALAIGGATGRPVRFVGRPDIAPVGPLLQRLGALLTRADELEGALRNGQVVVLGASATTHPRHVGRVDHHLVGAAVAAKVKVFPAATASAPMRRGARVEIGPAVPVNRRRRGPLAELELADALRARIAQQLSELGGTATGTPLDWLPLSGMGGA